jgi:hypothetical protein
MFLRNRQQGYKKNREHSKKNNAMIQYIVELAVHVTYGFLDSEPEQDSNHAKLEI